MVWQNRAWELKFSNTRGTIDLLKTYETKQHGIYQQFLVNHYKDNEWHCHVGLILQKPKIKFRTQKALVSYFNCTQVHPLRYGKGVLGKLRTYYQYCIDEKKHQGQKIEVVLGEKFDPNIPVKKIRLTKGAQILKQCIEEDKTLPQLLQEADWELKFYISKNATELRTTISNYRKMMQQQLPNYSLDDFKDTPQKRQIAAHTFKKENESKPKCLVIQGIQSDMGKTQIAKAKFKRPLVVRHIDKLKKLDVGYHDGIVFDDMSFSHWPREATISLFDLEEDADVNVKNSMVTIPSGFPRVFTTNRQMYQRNEFGDYDKETSFLPDTLGDGDTALLNRLSVVEVYAKLFS